MVRFETGVTEAAPTSREAYAPGFWLIIVLSALLAGWGELTLRLVASRMLPTPVFLDPSSVWTGPVSAAGVLFLPVGLAWLLGGWRGGSAPWRWALTVALGLAILDVILLLPGVHPAALAIAASGLAVQAVRSASNSPRRTRRAMRAVAGLLGIGTLLGGSAVTINRLWSDRRAYGGTGGTAGGPNVLLLVLDTVRALELSAYGNLRPTSPHLAALAADGVRFERAVATAPWTLPSHASMFTGLYPRELSTGWTTPLDHGPKTLAERFSERGYVTGGFVANFRYTSHEYGLSRGFQIYRDYAVTPSEVVGATMLGRRAISVWNRVEHDYILPGRKDGNRVVDEFLAFEQARGDRPYFAFLNLFDPHEPYAPAAPYDRLFLAEEPKTRAIEVGTHLDTAAIRDLRDAYDGSLAATDAAVGRLLDALRARGELDRTIVVVTSDHGEEFGGHGHMSHGNGLHMQALHVPLIIRWPDGGVPKQVVVPAPVSLRDLPATILELAGDTAAGAFPGVSLAPLWSGQQIPTSPIVSELFWVANQPEWYPVAAGNMHSLVRSGFHYIAGTGKATELYNVIADPLERRDLSRDSAYADTVRAMRETLAAWPLGNRRGK